MIGPNSASYPVAAASNAVGITYEEGYGYVWANRNLVASGYDSPARTATPW